MAAERFSHVSDEFGVVQGRVVLTLLFTGILTRRTCYPWEVLDVHETVALLRRQSWIDDFAFLSPQESAEERQELSIYTALLHRPLSRGGQQSSYIQ